MPRHDVAIYAPGAASYYDDADPLDSGGAERQTVLLARELARRGLRVAHIVFPVQRPVSDPSAPVTLVPTARPDAASAALRLTRKLVDVRRGLAAADAAVQVFRGADGTLGAGGAWCRVRRRRLIFAGANDADFTLQTFGGPRDPRIAMYRLGLRAADAIVVQSENQTRLAREGFAHVQAPLQVNSFVAPAEVADGGGEAFLWVSRLVDYKRPFLYADLAAALPEARFWMLPIRSADADHEDTLAELRRRAADLPNLELLEQRPHAELQALVGRAVAMVNTSSFEGMPNTWLEGWARGVPALTFSFDPDGRIARHGLGIDAGGDWDAFVAAARRLWERRADRDGRSEHVRAYVRDAHGTRVGDAWETLVRRLVEQ